MSIESNQVVETPEASTVAEAVPEAPPVENTPEAEPETTPEVIEESEPHCPKCNAKLEGPDDFNMVEGTKRKMWIKAGVRKAMIPMFAECKSCGNSMGIVGFRKAYGQAYTPAGNTEVKRKAARKASRATRKRNRQK